MVMQIEKANYFTFGVLKVANFTASFLDWLVEDFALDLKTLHITGHSLGAHTGGMTGHYLKKGTAARVTGIDFH